MTSHTTTPALNRLAVVLAAGVALMATANIAAAKSHHQENQTTSATKSSPRTLPSIRKEDGAGLRKEDGTGKHKHKGEHKDKDHNNKKDKRDKKKETKCKTNCESKPPRFLTITADGKKYKIPNSSATEFRVRAIARDKILITSGAYSVVVPASTVTVHGNALSASIAERGGLKETISNGDAVFTVVKPVLQGL